MVRLFNVYYSVRTLVLLGGEALILFVSFVIAARLRLGPDTYLVLNYELGFYKILGLTIFVLLCCYYFDLYEPQQLTSKSEVYFRLLVILSFLSFVLAGVSLWFPGFMMGRGVFLLAVLILTFALVLWRSTYSWLISRKCFSENVYVLGSGTRATKLVQAIRVRDDLGMNIVGWGGAIGGEPESRDDLGNSLQRLKKQHVNRIIVALADRRGTMPLRELLDLRLNGIKVEDAGSLLEKISGSIDLDTLYSSTLIFSDGFKLTNSFLLVQRLLSILASLVLLLICLPLLPFIILAIRLDSHGPALLRQTRVGRNGKVFALYKFRTMYQDAESKTGPTWTGPGDPRITRVGRFLRFSRMDELPQLWNVLRGDMGFVGPRPERPEFVQWLTTSIPFYHLRHVIRPGLTGWAQIRYRYGSSVEETKKKLEYDLYYIKHKSLMLDLLIIFETAKTVLLGRGSQ